MNTAPPEQQFNLMDELKEATNAVHTRLEATPYFEALAAGRLPLESYVGQLRALAAIHCVLEPALEHCSHPAVTAVWRPEMRKAALLEQDLQFFAPRGVPDLKEAVEETLLVVEKIRLWSVEQPLALLGCCYVLEGSTIGGALLCRQYAQTFLLERGNGIAYASSYLLGVHEHWEQFRRRMNALRASPPERKQVVDAAGIFFNCLEAVFKALYPFRQESRIQLVTSINPEAGRHPVPADPREFDASLRAADRCWHQFPYLKRRYGERGHRFARSDGAWLVTLCGYESSQIREQVSWLGRLLAARGMPTLLLEAQLEMLFEELVTAIPEKRHEYEKLRFAAAELRGSRHKFLSDQRLSELAKAFNCRVGAELSQQFPFAGRLLASAVADEVAGDERVVESLRAWMCNASQFTPEWIAAVDETVMQARRLALN